MRLNLRTITPETAQKMLHHRVILCEACGFIEPFHWVSKLDPVLQLEQQLQRELARLFKDMDKKFLAEMERRGVLALSATDRDKMVNRILTPVLEDMKKLIEELGLQGAELGRKTAIRDLKKAGMGIQFSEFNPAQRESLATRILQFSQRTTERISGNVMGSLLTSFENGLGIEQAGRRLGDVFDNMQRFELDRIARTEINSAQNEGNFATMEENGVRYKQWLTAQDDRVRGTDPKDKADHVKLHGEVVRMDETFSNGLRHPGDRQNGTPEEVINCRCKLRPYFPEEGENPEPTPYYPDKGIRKGRPKAPPEGGGGAQEPQGGGSVAGLESAEAQALERGMFPEGFEYTGTEKTADLLDVMKSNREEWFMGGYPVSGMNTAQRNYLQARAGKNIVTWEKTDKYFMQTDTKGKFWFSSHNFDTTRMEANTFGKRYYNPKAELDSAMEKLARGQSLNRAE